MGLTLINLKMKKIYKFVFLLRVHGPFSVDNFALAEGASFQERLPTHVCLQTGHCQIQVVGPAK